MRHESGESALAIGTVFQGGYEILAPLGAGRFGWVYKASQHSTGQDVAIKILRLLPGHPGRHREAARALPARDAPVLGLSHPNIVRLIDSGEADDGMLFAVFEHVPGTTLREVLAEERTLQVPEALHLMTQACGTSSRSSATMAASTRSATWCGRCGTEGFDSRDLREARALLEEIA